MHDHWYPPLVLEVKMSFKVRFSFWVFVNISMFGYEDFIMVASFDMESSFLLGLCEYQHV